MDKYEEDDRKGYIRLIQASMYPLVVTVQCCIRLRQNSSVVATAFIYLNIHI